MSAAQCRGIIAQMLLRYAIHEQKQVVAAQWEAHITISDDLYSVNLSHTTSLNVGELLSTLRSRLGLEKMTILNLTVAIEKEGVPTLRLLIKRRRMHIGLKRPREVLVPQPTGGEGHLISFYIDDIPMTGQLDEKSSLARAQGYLRRDISLMRKGERPKNLLLETTDRGVLIRNLDILRMDDVDYFWERARTMARMFVPGSVEDNGAVFVLFPAITTKDDTNNNNDSKPEMQIALHIAQPSVNE